MNNKSTKVLKLDFGVSITLSIAVIFFIVSGTLSYRNIQDVTEGTKLVTRTHEVILALETMLSLMKDAETGQRGYVLTGDAKYLSPYQQAITEIKNKTAYLKEQTKDSSPIHDRIEPLDKLIESKLAELASTIELRRTEGFEAALAVVKTDRGQRDMDAIRGTVENMKNDERDLRNQRIIEMNQAYRQAIFSGVASSLLGLLLSCMVAYLIRKASAARYREEWIANGELALSNAIAGEHRIDQLGQNVLKFFTDYFGAHAGAFFTKSDYGFQLTALHGVSDISAVPKQFSPNEGLLGKAAQDKDTVFISDVPEGYIKIGSALGESIPKHLIISAGVADDEVEAVYEVGFIHDFDAIGLELLKRVSNPIAIAVKSANYRASLQNLLEETQRQAEEIQAQSEELRVSNEELEEQSRALQESQGRMEQQQAELEQTNAQLEEQAQLLESQRDDLSKAQEHLQARTVDLERSSQYKSEFLANMSHELRTPLNSSLILSKLLADNPLGNLTDEQVKYAETIQSSGNDLLSLINDILDLSKIEAGHMDVQAEQIKIKKLVQDINRSFSAQAQQKGLTLTAEASNDCSEFLQTDGKRLEQILKNLLSNAIKFTEKGEVKLAITQDSSKRFIFTVSDTGIGIDEKNHALVFEAFRQADNTTSRKYGGTGLGLSISRELARLLGGYIELSSEVGKGSIFTLILPPTYDANSIRPAPERVLVTNGIKEAIISATPPVAPVAQIKRSMPDDTDRLVSNKHTILIVEDDPAFSKILYDLCQELGFQCLLAASADEAMWVAEKFVPSAVILDIGLPDHSGLSVLDRLKQNPAMRHIPVHVVSVEDYSQTAYAMGAIGYMLKPVQRDHLSQALKQIESRITQRMRRILVVEDDIVQLESVQKLLSLQNVETVGVQSAAECLQKLSQETYDCMVLDLSLQDASGYSLLETLSKDDAYSFPPVIVYTGRDLSADDEQRLRRYSRSIIVKGAKSPERLLDEVTLFLHQMVSDMPPEHQKMLKKAKHRDSVLEGRRILIVEDDVRNVYSLTSILEPRGAIVQIARNGYEALSALEASNELNTIDLVLMDVMMPELDGIAATKAIRAQAKWRKLPIIMLTAKAMKDDQERCIEAGANDYMAKPLDVEKLLSLVRVWMPR